MAYVDFILCNYTLKKKKVFSGEKQVKGNVLQCWDLVTEGTTSHFWPASFKVEASSLGILES